MTPGVVTIDVTQTAVPRGRAISLRQAVPWILAALGAAIWLLTLVPVTPDRLTDLGLISALPPGWWVAVLLVSLGIAGAIASEPADVRAGVVGIVVLAAILYATPALTEPLPRFNTVYVHLGFIEAIERTGRLYPDLDARFSWPVFFTAMAGFTSITGVDLLDVAAWVPLLTALVAMPAAWLLMRAFTDDPRRSLLALWLLLPANWVGQDYLSPQGFNFVLYLWLLALLAWFFGSLTPRFGRIRAWLRRPVQPEPADVPPAGASQWTRGSLVLAVTAIAATSVTSHQLTPFAMIGASAVLVLVSRTTLRWMPVLIAVMTGVWVVFAGYTFLAGHIEPLLQDIGNAAGAAQSGVVARIRGSDGHTFVVQERIVFSLLVWGLAGLGVLRRWWAGHWDLAAVLLAAYPFGLIVLQSYGGEIFLRVYLIALPAMAFLVAAALAPGPRLRGWRWVLPVVAVSMVLSAGFVVARYGNELMDVVMPGELEAVDRMHELAPEDSTVMATLNFNSPVRYRNVERFDFFDVPSSAVGLDKVPIVQRVDEYAQGRPAFLLISRGQLALETLNGATPEQIATMTETLDASPQLEIVFRNADATVYRLVEAAQP